MSMGADVILVGKVEVYEVIYLNDQYEVSIASGKTTGFVAVSKKGNPVDPKLADEILKFTNERLKSA